MSDFEMPQREPLDGPVRVERCLDINDGQEKIFIGCVTDSVQSDITCSPYNAVRILAALAVVFGVRFVRSVEKAIKL